MQRDHYIEQIDNQGTRHFIRTALFDDAAELVRWTDERHPDGYRGIDPDTWATGPHGLAGSRDRLTRGHAKPGEISKAHELAARFRANVPPTVIDTTTRRRVRYADEGAEPDIGRYLEGREDCWVDFPPGRSAPRVRLGIQYNQNCFASASDFANVGAHAAALAQALTACGWSVEIVGLVISKAAAFWHGPCFMVKAADETLDLARILAPAIPATLRIYGFAWRDEYRKSVPIGSSRELPDAVREALGLDYIIGQGWNEANTEVALRTIGADMATA